MARFDTLGTLGPILVASLLLCFPAVVGHAAETTRDLEIRTLELSDSSQDGVFQPGEALTLQLVLANPTDDTLRRRLSLSGPGLILDDEQWIEVPPRAVVELERPLAGLLDPALEARSETPIRLTVGHSARTLPLWVSHPLELDGEITVSAQSDGRAPTRIAVVIHNTSRKDSSALLQATVAAGRLVETSRTLPRIPAGASAEVSFELTGVEAEAVRSGGVTFEVVAAANGRTHDRIAYGHSIRPVALAGNRLSLPATP